MIQLGSKYDTNMIRECGVQLCKSRNDDYTSIPCWRRL